MTHKPLKVISVIISSIRRRGLCVCSTDRLYISLMVFLARAFATKLLTVVDSLMSILVSIFIYI